MSTAFIDRARLQAMLLDGEKIAAVASALECAAGSVSQTARDLGLRHVWATQDERALLADLRAGRAVVVRSAQAPAFAAFVSTVEAALRTYHSASALSPTTEERAYA